MIGTDFQKIEFQLFNLDLLEPMAFITDTILGGLAIFFAYKVSKIKSNPKGTKLFFYKYWKLFFLVFGIGAFVGGVGHTFYNQLGIPGKIPSWLCGPASIFFLEYAMISIYWDKKIKARLRKAAYIKLTVVYLVFFYLLLFVNTPENPNLPFMPIAFNTIVGVAGTAGILGYKYMLKFSIKFKFFWLGVLIMLPTSVIFLMKINIHQWFDKNDFSHILMATGITYFYLGVMAISKGLKQSRL